MYHHHHTCISDIPAQPTYKVNPVPQMASNFMQQMANNPVQQMANNPVQQMANNSVQQMVSNPMPPPGFRIAQAPPVTRPPPQPTVSKKMSSFDKIMNMLNKMFPQLDK